MKFFLTVAGLLYCSFIMAQMCPGGAVNFASGSVTFDPAWIYGCNTGTSCNGGVNFDNRAACQPTTAMDACAPVPTCGVAANNGSNIWFKFYAAATTVTISCFQNTSFVIAIQALKGGPTCGSLTEIGCAIAGGPSSGVNLTMTGLTVGELYYYRIFGSSGPIAQRTGLYCFCGTTGLQNYVLAGSLKSFKGYTDQESIKLTWEVSPDELYSEFNVELSTDERMFNTITTIMPSHRRTDYSFVFTPGDNHYLYYRLRYNNASGEVIFSPILKLRVKGTTESSFTVFNESRQLRIYNDKPSSFILCNAAGSVLKSYSLTAGENMLSVRNLSSGVYFIKNLNSNKVQKLAIL
ncbi:MAG TPA: hypothetical protein VM101_04735 [Flavitalea sp.]|nr:hypothetical protein [Flavitalea sp.]